ncbi:uncharacterized protein [Panulirus ornatus]|uniref:uncharacterized protein isoform X1 n=1 Tax=Panulirus ornatus TaxID=150431 RepID=UPI003A8653C1
MKLKVLWIIAELVSMSLAVPIFSPVIGNGTLDQTNRVKRCRRYTSADYRGYYNHQCYYPYHYNCYNPCMNWPITAQPPTVTRPPYIPVWPTRPPRPPIDPTPPATRPPYTPIWPTVPPRPPIDPTPPATRPPYTPIWPTRPPRPPIDPTPPATRPPYTPIWPTVPPRPPIDPTPPATRPPYTPIWPTRPPRPPIDPTPPATRPPYTPIWPTVPPRPPIDPTPPATRPPYTPIWPTRPPRPPIDPTPPATRPPYTPIWPTVPPRPPIDPTPPATRPPYTPVWPTRPPRPPIDPTPPATRPPYTPIWPTRPPRPPIDPTPPATRPPYTPIWPTRPPRPPIDPTPPATRPPYTPVWPTRPPRPPIDPTPPATRPPYTPVWPTRPPRPPIDPTPPATRPPYTPIWPTVPPRPPTDPTPPQPTFPPVTSAYIRQRCSIMCESNETIFRCCEHSSPASGRKGGECPAQVSTCPEQPNNSNLHSHKFCKIDNQCEEGEGCCYDRCLEDYVCATLSAPHQHRQSPQELHSNYDPYAEPQAHHQPRPPASQPQPQTQPPGLNERSAVSVAHKNTAEQAVTTIQVLGPWDDPRNFKFLKEELLPLVKHFSRYVSVQLLPDVPQRASRKSVELVMCGSRHVTGQQDQVTFALCLTTVGQGSSPHTTSLMSQAKKCARQQRQRWKPLRTCVSSGEGRQLLKKAQRRRKQLLQTATRKQATREDSIAPVVAVDGVVVEGEASSTPGWLARLTVCSRLGETPEVASMCPHAPGTAR